MKSSLCYVPILWTPLHRDRVSRELSALHGARPHNYLRLIGANHRALFKETEQEAPGFAFVVRSMTLDYLKPARMDDVLTIATVPEEVKGASITLHQQVRRGEELLVEAHVRVAFISRGRARPIPKPLRIAMKANQEKTTPTSS